MHVNMLTDKLLIVVYILLQLCITCFMSNTYLKFLNQCDIPILTNLHLVIEDNSDED